MLAYSTGKYAAGTNDSDVESTVRQGKGLKRSLTSVSSPQKSPVDKTPRPTSLFQESQDPNGTPLPNKTPGTPPPPTPVAGAPPASSAMPPPSAPAEGKDALYWKPFSLK